MKPLLNMVEYSLLCTSQGSEQQFVGEVDIFVFWCQVFQDVVHKIIIIGWLFFTVIHKNKGAGVETRCTHILYNCRLCLIQIQIAVKVDHLPASRWKERRVVCLPYISSTINHMTLCIMKQFAETFVQKWFISSFKLCTWHWNDCYSLVGGWMERWPICLLIYSEDHRNFYKSLFTCI